MPLLLFRVSFTGELGFEINVPADYGSHPEFRTEWWYVTGWLSTDHGEPLGFQITFFRTKPAVDMGNPSAFAAHQLLIAHCAQSAMTKDNAKEMATLRDQALKILKTMNDDVPAITPNGRKALIRGSFRLLDAAA